LVWHTTTQTQHRETVQIIVSVPNCKATCLCVQRRLGLGLTLTCLCVWRRCLGLR